MQNIEKTEDVKKEAPDIVILVIIIFSILVFIFLWYYNNITAKRPNTINHNQLLQLEAQKEKLESELEEIQKQKEL